MGKPTIFPFDPLNLIGVVKKLDFRNLSEQTTVEDADLLASYRSTGPLKRLTASVARVYMSALSAAKAANLSDLASLEVANRSLGTFATRALATAATISTVLTTITLRGYAAAGDGGAATYKRATSQPAHAAKLQSADGAWWEYVPPPEGINVKALGATGDDSTDDTTAIHNARDCGLSSNLIFPTGTYRTTGITFSASDTIENLHFCPGSHLKLIAASARIALSVQKQLFSITGICEITGTGTPTDGLATVGFKHGTVGTGQAYLTIDHIKVQDNFSAFNFVVYGCVNVAIRRADINAGNPLSGATCYGMSFEAGAAGSTVVKIDQAYISGGLRGFNATSTSWMSIDTMAIEYAGGSSGEASGSENGALHLTSCANVVITNLYGEQNQRNRVIKDSTPIILAGEMFASVSAPDVVSYSAIPAGERGYTEIGGNTVKTRYITFADDSTYDLEIGDLVVPYGGGATRLAGYSCSQASGTLAGISTWTTIATLDGQDTAAIAPYNLVRYVYDVWLGYAGNDTGTDYGVVRRGVLSSQGGVDPSAWLRISSNNLLQIKSENGGAGGLDWGLTLQRIAAGPLAS